MQSPYDPALRAEIRRRMSPPNRESVAEIARSTGVNSQTLYSWRHRWKQEGQLAPATSKAPEQWSPAAMAPADLALLPARQRADHLQSARHGVGGGVWRSGGRHRDPRSTAAPQPCADNPGRQLPAQGEAAQRPDPPAGGRSLLTRQRWPAATAAQ